MTIVRGVCQTARVERGPLPRRSKQLREVTGTKRGSIGRVVHNSPGAAGQCPVGGVVTEETQHDRIALRRDGIHRSASMQGAGVEHDDVAGFGVPGHDVPGSRDSGRGRLRYPAAGAAPSRDTAAAPDRGDRCRCTGRPGASRARRRWSYVPAGVRRTSTCWPSAGRRGGCRNCPGATASRRSCRPTRTPHRRAWRTPPRRSTRRARSPTGRPGSRRTAGPGPAP